MWWKRTSSPDWKGWICAMFSNVQPILNSIFSKMAQFSNICASFAASRRAMGFFFYEASVPTVAIKFHKYINECDQIEQRSPTFAIWLPGWGEERNWVAWAVGQHAHVCTQLHSRKREQKTLGWCSHKWSCACTPACLSCSPVPNRPQPNSGPRPGGWGLLK